MGCGVARSVLCGSRAAARVLMLGNSLTSSAGLPERLAQRLGCEVTALTRGGARLAEFLNPKTKSGARLAQVLQPGSWDFVVLQEMSNGPITSRERFLESAALLSERAKGCYAQVVFYETPAYAPMCPKLERLGMDSRQMQRALHAIYELVAGQDGALLAQVGSRFAEYSDPAQLYASDGVHLSEAGADLAAEVLAETLLSASCDAVEVH